MKINKYYDFISESKLSLILEANMTYSDKFVNILSNLKSPIAKQILDSRGKDIDVSTNYIDLTDKDDTIAFLPENKVKGVQTKVKDTGNAYEGLTDIAVNKNLFGVKRRRSPRLDQLGTIIRELTVEDLNSMYKTMSWQVMYNAGQKVVVFRFKETNGEEYESLISTEGLTSNIDGIPKSEIKVGRFAKRLLDKSGVKPTDKDIEEFVNQFRSRIEIEKDVFRLFEVVNGENIKKFYSQGMYSQVIVSGTLWQSCMRYDKCQNFFDIYVDNPDQVSLVILKDEQKEVEMVDTITGEITTQLEDVRIRGRALLWTDEKGRKFMDRIYYTKDSDVELFKQYAIKNEWCYKLRQENDEHTPIVFNGETLQGEENIVTVILTNGGDYNRYPYMDTLKYYAPHGKSFGSTSGVLSNNDRFSYEYKLEDTEGGNGSCDNCGGSGETECYSCEGSREESCSDCHGDGSQECGNCNGSGNIEDLEGNETPCKDCNGSGTEKCDSCGGSGSQECSDCDGSGRVDCGDCN